MKRPSFIVHKKRKDPSWQSEVEGTISQVPYDYQDINEIERYPKKYGTLKITYIPSKTGKFISRHFIGDDRLFFYPVNEKGFLTKPEEKEEVEDYFLNCLLKCDIWPVGTRFNRKVEIIKSTRRKK